MLLLLVALLIACDKVEEQGVPSLIEESKAYLDILKSGDKAKISDVFFMPLYQKDTMRLVKSFNKKHDKLVTGKLKLNIEAVHQQGRWGLVIFSTNEDINGTQAPLWFFYYKRHWRVISPEIYHTKEVRAMINLYPEYKVLTKWLPERKANK